MPRGGMLLVAAALLVGSSSLLPAASSQEAAPANLTTAVAVLREDGVLLPFARYRDGRWHVVWPEPVEAPTLPSSVDGVPPAWFPPDGDVPATWLFWPLVDPQADASPFEMRKGRPLAVERPVTIDAHCQKQVGLQTPYRGPAERQRPTGTSPKLKAGLAVTSPALRVDRPVDLDPASPLAAGVAQLALVPFHRAEDRYLENVGEQLAVQLEPFAKRRTVPVRWTRVLRHGTAQAANRVYYLEGEIEYSPLTIMAGTVWVRINNDRETIDVETQQVDQDHGRTHRQPLGIIVAGARTFWVFETLGYEEESYEVVEIPAPGRAPTELVKVSGGGC